MTRGSSLALLALLAGTPAPAQDLSTPAEAAKPAPGFEDRKRELLELRRRLAELKARWTATKKKQEDLKEALKAADLDLEIRTAERRVL